MEYPQYRKYKNDRSYFKITGPAVFIEFKWNGKIWERFDFEAKILPDRNYLADLLFNYEAHWDKITEEEFEDGIS